jgi:hypothetical protein
MITLFHSDFVEKQALIPLKDEFESLGYSCKFSTNFDEESEVGIYACHSNYFALNKPGGWYRPPSKFSVICLHDFYHDNGQRSKMFLNDSWHIFDLALLPGKRWLDIYQEGLDNKFEMPRLGVREVGWPVSDCFFNNQVDADLEVLKSKLNLDYSKKTILLGASWQSRSMIKDCLRFLNQDNYNVVAKFFNWQNTDFGYGSWADIFRAQCKETEFAKELAMSSGFKIAPADINISALLSVVDVVLSNGSNIMFEGLLQEKPSICIRDWFHPYGDRGQFKYFPTVEMEGIINGSKKDMAALVEAAIYLDGSPLLKLGRQLFVSDENLGRGAFLSANAILKAYQSKENIEKIQLPIPEDKILSEIEILQNEILKDPDRYFDEQNILHIKKKSDWLYKEKLRLENDYFLLMNSLSWRITKPLRTIKQYLFKKPFSHLKFIKTSRYNDKNI